MILLPAYITGVSRVTTKYEYSLLFSIFAPVDGIVHSFAFKDAFGDYGATIILTHQLNGISFYTLYGHLSLNSIKNLQEGEQILQGDIFAEFGIPSENGQWPPHLHFQIITDLQGWKGDYPGVCKFSEKEKWLGNCPDPDLILQLNQYLKVSGVPIAIGKSIVNEN